VLATLSGGELVEARRQRGRAHVLALHSVSRLLSDVDQLYREQLTRRLGQVPS